MVDDQLKFIIDRLRIVLDELIGEFSDGREAIAVEPPEDDRRKSTTGIQISIPRQPMGRLSRLSRGEVYKDQYYQVTLINFDRSSPNMAEATRRIELEFVLKGAPIYTPATSENYEQCVFNICSPTVIHN